MLKFIFRTIFKLKGWKIEPNLPKEINRCVLIAVPHTSNWDFVYCLATFDLLNIPIKFTIKDSWLKGPLGGWMKKQGAVGIDRSPKIPGQPRKSTTEAMIDLFEQNKGQFAMIVTPEGTRKKRTEWKTGFYYVAKGAGVPICLANADYKNKTGYILDVIHPTDDMEADLRKIMAAYKGKTHPKHPELFSLDLRYI